MANTIGVVSLRGLYAEEFQHTWLGNGITAADVGKAVAQDTTAANTVKLAGDGEEVIGRVEVVEVRTTDAVTTVTVAHKGGMRFPINPNATASSPDETPAVGDLLVGGTATSGAKGYVQKAQSGDRSNLRVVELEDAAYLVAVLF